MALVLRLTKEVTSDKARAGPPLPRIVVERILEVEPRLTSRPTITLEVRVVQRWHRTEKRQNHTTKCLENESERFIVRTLTGKARMNAHKDRVVERESK